MPDLFDQLTLGTLEIPNRVVMAPLTACALRPTARRRT